MTRTLATFFSFEVSWTRLETFAAAAVAARFSLSLFDLHQRGQAAAAAASKFKSTRMLKTESERETLIIPRFLIFLIRFSCCLFKVSPPSSLALLCFVSVCLV